MVNQRQPRTPFTAVNSSATSVHHAHPTSVVQYITAVPAAQIYIFFTVADSVNDACCILSSLHISSSSSSSTPLPVYCLRENISFDTLIRRSSRSHNSRKATQPSHCGTCLILLIFIAKRVQPSLPSSTLRSNFVYPRQISRSPRVGHCMS